MPTPYKFDIEGLIKSNIITVKRDVLGKTVEFLFSPQMYSDISFKYQIPKDDIYRLIGKYIYEADKGMWDTEEN